jgi:hypothetical protein
MFQPLTILLKLGKGDGEKRPNDPGPENQSENNTDSKKHCSKSQGTPAPFPVQDQHHQVKQKNGQHRDKAGKESDSADQEQSQKE